MNVLVVGQGLAGTLISYELFQKKIHHKVVDKGLTNSATMAAAGICNPVTGRNFVKSWMYDILLKKVDETYPKLDQLLSIQAFKKVKIWRKLTTIKAENAWLNRTDDPAYKTFFEGNGLPIKKSFFTGYEAHYIGIVGARQVQISGLVQAYRQWLKNRSQLIEHSFDELELEIKPDGFLYLNEHFSHIIFCQGAIPNKSGYFSYLPFKNAKGQSLICKSPLYMEKDLVKNHFFLVPQGDHQFWTGGEYEWNAEGTNPTEVFRQEYETYINALFEDPVEIIHHRAGVRPCAIDRRPFLGRHPLHSNMLIFNGLGTKGTSLGPYFANHLVNHITENTALMEDVNILRFQ